jgi:hypothetical protein
VRQIQNKALAKIRSVMEDGVLRTVPRTEEQSKAITEAPSAPPGHQSADPGAASDN